MNEKNNDILPRRFKDKRFYSADRWLKDNLGEKTIKLAIDGGFTCPNRDGSKGVYGCSFCSDSGSGEFASSVDQQIELLSKKWPKARYLAYFRITPTLMRRWMYFGENTGRSSKIPR